MNNRELLVQNLFPVKNTSTSMCLVLLWKTGLWAMETALWLSQKITGVVKETCNSISKVWIQVNSVEVWAILRYSAFVLNLTITFCLRDHQDIKFRPRKMAVPEVKRLSSTSDAQLVSQNALIIKGFVIEVGWRSRPWDKVPLRYF